MLDLCSRDIVSYTIYDHPVLNMVTEMLDKAFEVISDGTNLILKIGGKYGSRVLFCLASHEGCLRFNELRHCMGDIPCKTLSSTLKKLEDDELLLRTEFPQIPPKVEYSLTPRGTSLLPILRAMCCWGTESRQRQSEKERAV